MIPPITHPPHTHKTPTTTPKPNRSNKTVKLLLALANNALETYSVDLEEKTYQTLSALDGPGHR
jgi:hypothetical protein